MTNPFLKKPKEKTAGLPRKQGDPSPSFPVSFIILMSVFLIVITLLGFRQIKDTLRPRNQTQNTNPSFEETMMGIMFMESRPDIRISKQQADQIMAVTGPYLQYPDVFKKVENAVSICLNDKQKKFIIANSGRSFNPGVKYEIPPGLKRIEWIFNDLEKFSAGTEAPVYNNKEIDTIWLERIPGIEDMVEGLYHLKHEEELTRSQAAYIAPYLKEMALIYKKIDAGKQTDREKIWSFLTDQQKEFLKQQTQPVPPDFVRTYMPDIMKLLNAKTDKTR